MTRALIIFATNLLVLVILSRPVTAQTEADTVGSLSGVEIETSVDRTESYVGDFINYTVTITYDSSYELTPPPLGANLGMFEVKDYEPDIETKLDDGRIKSQTKFVVSTYTTGEYVIPPVPVMFTLPDATVKVMVSEALPITILSLLGDGADSLSLKGAGTAESLKGNKAPFTFKRDYTMYYVYGGAGFVILLGGLFFWLWWRKNRRRGEVEDDREPWEIAFERMAVLKEQRYIESHAFKLYYVDLTELAREFLGRVYQLDALEMTTDEFRVAFKDRLKPEALFDQTLEFMRHADLVKFARYEPGVERAESDYLFAHELIADIRDEFLRKADEARLAEEARKKKQPNMPEAQNV